MDVALVVDRLRAAGCVFAEDEAELLVAEAASPGRLEDLVRRRVAGEPLEHLVGWTAFDGLRIAVGAGVFVPRRRTELLVREAAALIRPGAVVVDLCCGSGAVGAALLARQPGIDLHAADVDPVAVRCARGNLPGVPVHEGDLFAALPADLRGRVDVLAANVPYVPTTALALMPPEARDHEPRTALDGGDDGLAVARRVIDGAPEWLAPGGSLLFEAGTAQLPAAVAALTAAGLRPRVVADDERGATVVVGGRGSRLDG
ncbi:release factor glutamine methyltransferase [Blastococcus fimeti]|nr:release factor glutamine methyltransferase [Blastococcus fimeti]